MNHRFDYAFYVPSFVGGGAERNCVLLANELCKRGLRVCFIVDNDHGPNRRYLSGEIRVYVLGEVRHATQMLRLRRVLRESEPRAVFVQVGLSPIKFQLASCLLRRRPVSIVVYHGMYDPAWRLGSKLSYWLAPLIVRLFDATVSVSGGLRDQLAQRFRADAGRIKVIHNPVDLSMLDSLAEASGTVVPTTPYLISVGRLIPLKGFSSLLRAFSLIAGQIPHDLVIVGEGPQRDQLVEETEKLGLDGRVMFTGYLGNPFPLVRGANVFVLASAAEAFGNVLVEALSFGLRVVSTDCPGGPREILADGEHGVLCALGEPAELAEAILAALRAPHDPQAGRRRAMNFSVDRIADQYLAVARAVQAS